jgi:hypothetical protein
MVRPAEEDIAAVARAIRNTRGYSAAVAFGVPIEAIPDNSEVIARAAVTALAGCGWHPHYTSTYCQHAEHKTCRLTCKTCAAGCRCECHAEGAAPGE